MSYEHVQTSPLAPLAFVVPVVGFAITAAIVPRAVVLVPTAAFAVVVAAILLTSSRLTVTVSDDAVRASFGVGVPRRTVPLHRIVQAHQIRNR